MWDSVIQLHFFKDGEFSISGGAGNWAVKEGKLVFYMSQSNQIGYSQSFRDNNKQLTIKKGWVTELYIKQ